MTSPVELRQWIAHATDTLAQAGVDSPRADAEQLAAHVLGVTRGRVGALAVMGHPLLPDDVTRLDGLLASRAERVPLQHLTGQVTFRGSLLHVGQGVFLPRPETEDVAGLAVAALRRAAEQEPDRSVLAVDLCTGSGAIAAALADEVPEAVVHAVELDPEAARWAVANLERRGVALHLDDARTALPGLTGRADVVVSNPPYVPDGRVPTQTEATRDPELALYGGGADGMQLPTAIIAAAARLLRPGGFFVMEHDETQEQSVAEQIRRTGVFQDITGHRDLSERPRSTSARLSARPGPDQTTPDGRMSA